MSADDGLCEVPERHSWMRPSIDDETGAVHVTRFSPAAGRNSERSRTSVGCTVQAIQSEELLVENELPVASVQCKSQFRIRYSLKYNSDDVSDCMHVEHVQSKSNDECRRAPRLRKPRQCVTLQRAVARVRKTGTDGMPAQRKSEEEIFHVALAESVEHKKRIRERREQTPAATTLEGEHGELDMRSFCTVLGSVHNQERHMEVR